MKVFKKVIFIVIFMLATLANYANKNNFYNAKNNNNITFVFKGTKKGHQLKVKDQNGEVLYSEEIKRKGNITKSFNFNNLKDGSYTLELEKDFEIIVKSIKIERNKVVIEKAENIIFKPVIRHESDKLMISKITFDKNLNLDTKKLIYSINKKTKAVILANPNQPTGTIIDKKKLKKIIYLSKKFNFLLLIDEAYIDFCKKNSVISEINRYNNIFVTRTFSKAFGLAGLRLGFIASSKNNIKELIKVKPLSDINSLSIKISLLLLNNIKEVEKNIKNINLSKEKIANFCKKNNITFINSKTNFVHLQFEDSNKVKELFSLFKKNKILARSNFEGLPASIENSLRFSLGELSTSRKIIKILKKHYKL